MKIAYIITGLACGGAESQLATICNALRKEHIVKVFSISSNIDIIDRFTGIDVETISLKDIRNFSILYSKLKSFNPDVVHSHMVHSNIIAPVVSYFLRKPCFITAHNVNEGNKLRMLTLKLVLRIFKPNVSHVSIKGIEFYKANKFCKDAEIYINPISLEKFSSGNKQRNSSVRWVNVASLTKQKRHDRLIKVFKEYLKKFPLDTLYIIGDGPEKKEISKLVNYYGLQGNISLIGKSNNISGYLKESDYFIMSSDWEGLPVAIIEALSSQVPVLSTNCGDIDTVIKNGYNGLLSDKTNSSLLTGMLNLRAISNLEYVDYATNARESVKKFSIQQIKCDLIKRYTSKI